MVAYAVRAEEILLPVEIDAKRDGTLELLFLDQTVDDRKLLPAGWSPVGVNGYQHCFSGFLGLDESRLIVGDPFRRVSGSRIRKNRQKDYGKHPPETLNTHGELSFHLFTRVKKSPSNQYSFDDSSAFETLAQNCISRTLTIMHLDFSLLDHPLDLPQDPPPNQLPGGGNHKRKTGNVRQETRGDEQDASHEDQTPVEQLDARHSPPGNFLLDSRQDVKSLGPGRPSSEGACKENDPDCRGQPDCGSQLDEQHQLQKGNCGEEKQETEKQIFIPLR